MPFRQISLRVGIPSLRQRNEHWHWHWPVGLDLELDNDGPARAEEIFQSFELLLA